MDLYFEECNLFIFYLIWIYAETLCIFHSFTVCAWLAFGKTSWEFPLTALNKRRKDKTSQNAYNLSINFAIFFRLIGSHRNKIIVILQFNNIFWLNVTSYLLFVIWIASPNYYYNNTIITYYFLLLLCIIFTLQ